MAACAPRLAAPGPRDGPPALEAGAFLTRDGLRLGLDVWPAGRPRAALIALHGMNDYANAFALPGPWFAAQGVTVYAYDQRGFGRAPETGIWPGTPALTGDLRDMLALVRAAHPDLPVYVLGESMGGAVAMVAAAEGLAADGLILAAPAVWGWSTLGLPGRIALWLAAHVTPWGPLEPPQGIRILPSDNRAVLRGLAEDPLFIKTTRSDALYGLVTLMDEAYRAAGRVPPPVLLLYGRNDDIIPPGPTADVLSRMPSARVVVYARGHHMLLRDLQRARVWADVLAFIADPAGPLPSGEERPPPPRPRRCWPNDRPCAGPPCHQAVIVGRARGG